MDNRLAIRDFVHLAHCNSGLLRSLVVGVLGRGGSVASSPELAAVVDGSVTIVVCGGLSGASVLG